MPRWRIAAWQSERAFGTITDESGTSVDFALEAWVPCDPKTARRLDDSDVKRHALMPKVGEPVDVEWKLARAAKVTRITPIVMLPDRTFRDWLAAMAMHIPALVGFDGNGVLEDEVDSREKEPPEALLGILAYVKLEAPSDHLAWFEIDEPAGAIRLEVWGDHPHVYAMLPTETIAALVAAKLVRLA